MLLSLLIFLPIFFAAGRGDFAQRGWIRPASFVIEPFAFPFELCLVLSASIREGDAAAGGKGASWVPTFGINYFVGIDGISFWLVILSAFLTPLVILGSWNAAIRKECRARFISASFLLLTSTMGKTRFVAMDAVLFYVFFETSLIPMYFFVGGLGRPAPPHKTCDHEVLYLHNKAGSLFMLMRSSP